MNDRLNISFQRDLIKKFVVDITYFANFGRDFPYTKRFNLMDPQLSYQYKTTLSTTVANPFYNYLTPDNFPGTAPESAAGFVGQPVEAVSSIWKCKPDQHAGSAGAIRRLADESAAAIRERLQFLWTYNYNRERQQQFFNTDEEYAGKLPVGGQHQAAASDDDFRRI